MGGFGTGAVIGGGVGSSSKKSSAKVTIEDNAQVTAENSEHGIGAAPASAPAHVAPAK